MRILSDKPELKEINLRFRRYGQGFDLEACTSLGEIVVTILRINENGYLVLHKAVEAILVSNGMDTSELAFDENGALVVI